MSRYAVTYRIDGGPGLSGWAERTCNSVNVYANKDDMTPVNGATIVTYSDVPTEVHVVPTTKDCNGADDISNVGAPNVQSFGTFVATGTTPNIWKETQVWDVTGAQPAVLYNTTGFDISASYVEYGEYDIAVKIESSQPIFDTPASFTTFCCL